MVRRQALVKSEPSAIGYKLRAPWPGVLNYLIAPAGQVKWSDY